MDKNCKYCHETFKARRRNHVYCCSSCKTMASYKRNDYKYVAGHYQKDDTIPKVEGLNLPEKTDIMDSIKILETKINNIQKAPKVDVNSITSTALGSATADAAIYGAKKLFAPNTLPATKGDIDKLKKEITELKTLLNLNHPKAPFNIY